MIRMRSFPWNIAAMSIGAISMVYSCGAKAAHAHCQIHKWSLSSSDTEPKVPTTEKLIAFSFKPLLNEPPPPNTNDCRYEISDVTQIDVKLEYEGSIVWEYLVAGDFKPNGTTYFNPPLNASNNTTYYQFPSHLVDERGQNDWPVEVDMESTIPFTFKFIPYNNSAKITSANLTLNGHHYYTLPVPEPSTYSLMLGGLGLLGWIRRRKSTKFS